MSHLHFYECAHSATDVADLRPEGLALRLTKGSELEVFSGSEGMPALLGLPLLK